MFHFSNFPPPSISLPVHTPTAFQLFSNFEKPFSTATTFNLQGVTVMARMLSSKASSLCKSNAVQLLNTRLVLFASFSAMESVSEEVEVFLRNEKVDVPFWMFSLGYGHWKMYMLHVTPIQSYSSRPPAISFCLGNELFLKANNQKHPRFLLVQKVILFQ